MTKATVHVLGEVPVTTTRSKTGSRLEIAGYASVDFSEDTEVTLVSGEAKPKPKPTEAKGEKAKVTDDDHRVTVLTPDERRKVMQAMYEGGNHPNAKELEEFKDEAWVKLGPRPRAKKDRVGWWEKWNKVLGK